MTITVVDASVLMAWLFAETDEPKVASAFAAVESGQAAAPFILWFEMRNVLLVAERKGRISRAQSATFLDRIATLAIQMELPSGGETLSLARSYGLTFYDGAYLELAKRRAAPLATLDRALEKAAAAEGVFLLKA